MQNVGGNCVHDAIMDVFAVCVLQPYFDSML